MHAVAGDSQAGKLHQLRFSPDGHYVLAQDDTEITVLTLSPFAVLFGIHAVDATDAQFTPDSLDITFISTFTRVSPQRITYVKSAAHIERWSIAEKKRIAYVDIPASGCGTAALSPDGRTFVCNDFEGTLRIVDTDRSQTIFEKTQFIRFVVQCTITPGIGPDQPCDRLAGDLGAAEFRFSPDGRFLIAVPFNAKGRTIVWDLKNQAVVKLTGALKQLQKRPRPLLCSFTSSDRLLIACTWWPIRHGAVLAKLISFPSGKTLSRPRIPLGPVHRAADPNYVLVRPFGRNAFTDDPNAGRAAAAEIDTGNVIISDTPALDVFGGFYVAEPSPGVVGLYERGKGLQSSVALYRR